jgi:Flp pilus assembly pilin Flp
VVDLLQQPGPSASPNRVEAVDTRARDRGAALVEYALLISLIVLVCIAALALMGESVDSLYSSAVGGLD